MRLVPTLPTSRPARARSAQNASWGFTASWRRAKSSPACPKLRARTRPTSVRFSNHPCTKPRPWPNLTGSARCASGRRLCGASPRLTPLSGFVWIGNARRICGGARIPLLLRPRSLKPRPLPTRCPWTSSWSHRPRRLCPPMQLCLPRCCLSIWSLPLCNFLVRELSCLRGVLCPARKWTASLLCGMLLATAWNDSLRSRGQTCCWSRMSGLVRLKRSSSTSKCCRPMPLKMGSAIARAFCAVSIYLGWPQRLARASSMTKGTWKWFKHSLVCVHMTKHCKCCSRARQSTS